MNTVSDIERLINEHIVGFRAERNREKSKHIESVSKIVD